MIKRRRRGDADDNADEKVGFERLLFGFMAKELLAHNGTRPAARRAKYQQRSFRDPAHAFARRHFIGAIHAHRQHIDQQKPHAQRTRSKKAAYRSEYQE